MSISWEISMFAAIMCSRLQPQPHYARGTVQNHPMLILSSNQMGSVKKGESGLESLEWRVWSGVCTVVVTTQMQREGKKVIARRDSRGDASSAAPAAGPRRSMRLLTHRALTAVSVCENRCYSHHDSNTLKAVD